MKLNEVEQKIRGDFPEAVFRQGEAMAGIAWAVQVPLAMLRDCARVFDAAGFFLETITALDFEDAYELVYHFNFYEPKSRVAIRAACGHEEQAPTICDIFRSAGWLEREVHDFFGIVFSENPDLRPLFLPEDADYHPLRKTFGKVSAYRKRDEIYG